MANHFIGITLESGKVGRVGGALTEEAFNAFVARLGGELLPDMVAWHIDENAEVFTSPALQALMAVPFVAIKENGELALVKATDTRRMRRMRLARLQDIAW